MFWNRLCRMGALLVAVSIAGCTAGAQIMPTATVNPTETASPSPTVTASPSVAATEAAAEGGTVEAAPASVVETLVPEIVARYPHDTGAYTQGLVWFDGVLYESTGNYPADVVSSLREVELASGEVVQSIELPLPTYAEGLALADDRLIQLTWKDQVAFIYDRETFEQIGTFSYIGEGWGICYDGTEFYMSDGTNMITVRNETTFEPMRTIPVTVNGGGISNLNEIECVGDFVYANVWKTDQILRIDKATGVVTGVVIAGGLLAPGSVTDGEAVLNGIAYNPESETFYITGKMWPWLFEVRFVTIDQP